jgi:hypothetical protein
MILGMSMSAFAFAHIAEYFHEDGAVFFADLPSSAAIGSDTTRAAIPPLVAHCDGDVGCATHGTGPEIEPTSRAAGQA